MILTEDKTYTISLEQEDCGSTTGLVNKNTELVFSNKELLHEINLIHNNTLRSKCHTLVEKTEGKIRQGFSAEIGRAHV